MRPRRTTQSNGLLRRLPLIAATTAVALGWLTPGAFAYWSSTGQASAPAGLATLSAPTISSATSGAEAVTLTWSTVTPPGTGTVEYYVSRDDGAPSSGCPSSSSHSSATSCTDTGVSIGTHEYTVTAVWRSWTATSTARSATVAFGPATHFQLEVANTTPTAGEADNLTITAKDASNNTVGTYSGAHSLVFAGPSEAPNGATPVVIDSAGAEKKLTEPTAISFTEGKASVSGSTNGVLKLYDAQGTALKATEGTIEGTSGTLVVKAASADGFGVPTPSEQTAGTAFNVKLTATDEWGNTATSYAGKQKLVWSGPSSSPTGKAPSYPATVTFTAGVGTAASIKLYGAQSTTLTASEGAIEGTSGVFTVNAAATTKKFIVQTPSEPEAGVAFNVTLTATDEWGNKTAGYAGGKTLGWSGPSSSPNGQAPSYPGAATTVTFTAGEGTASSITLYDAQSTALKATDGTIEGTSGALVVNAASADGFSVSTPSEQTAGTAFNVKLTATDEWGNTATSYMGSKTLTWGGPSSAPNGAAPEYPMSATAVTFTAGVGTASSIKLFDAQSTTLAATDGTIEATSGSFTVKAATAKKFSVPTPSEQEAGVAFNVTLTATDEWGNTAKSYTGSKTLTWSGPASSPAGATAEYPTSATTVTFTEGVGTASAVKLFDAQSTTLKAKQSTTEGVSGSFTVTATSAERFAWSRAEVTSGTIKAGTCPFACLTTSIGHSQTFTAYASVTDQYGNVVSNLSGSHKAKVEKASGAGTLANATALTIPTSGRAESATMFEYTSPASGTSEAVLTLKVEAGTAYTEAEAHVKY